MRVTAIVRFSRSVLVLYILLSLNPNELANARTDIDCSAGYSMTSPTLIDSNWLVSVVLLSIIFVFLFLIFKFIVQNYKIIQTHANFLDKILYKTVFCFSIQIVIR